MLSWHVTFSWTWKFICGFLAGRMHLPTQWSHSASCLPRPSFHSAQYCFTINEFRRGVLWHNQKKHDVSGSCNHAEGGGLPTIKTTSRVLFRVPDSTAHTLLLAGWEGWRDGELGGMEREREAAWSCRVSVQDNIWTIYSISNKTFPFIFLEIFLSLALTRLCCKPQ